MAKIKAIIDRFEGEKAVLRFTDSQQLIIDKDFLDSDSQEGDAVSFNLHLEKNLAKHNLELAKQILQQILTHESPNSETT